MLGDPSKIAQNAAAGPKNVSMLLDAHKYVMEPKYDGFRLLVHVLGNGKVEFYTRTGNSQRGKLPFVEAALGHLPADTWFDGEIIALDANGLPEWGKVQSKMGSTAGDPTGELVFIAFDLLAFGGLDVRPLPLAERRLALEAALPKGPHTRITPQGPATDAWHDKLVAEGYEGTIVKDPTKPYASGKRGQGWWKLKASDEMDVVIMGFKPGENSFTGLIGAIEFGQYKDGVLTHRGRCSGMDMKMRKELTARAQEFIGNQQVISLAYMGIMPSGSPRHPQYKRLRIDKSAEECIWS